jgi:hypothetical protein
LPQSKQIHSHVIWFTDTSHNLLHLEFHALHEAALGTTQEDTNMKLIHKTRATLAVTFALAATAAISEAQALSDTLQKYRTMCEQNADCSAEMTDRGLLFKLRTAGRTEQLLCQDDGACDVLAPRGGHFRVKDAEAWLAQK